MSVSTNDRRTTISASNGQTALSGDFILYDESQVVVTRTRSGVDATLALTTDYTVSGTGVAGGFTVTLVSAAQTGDVYVIEGDRPVTSDAAFSTGGDFMATEVNGRLDRAAVERQELRRDVDDLIGVVGDLEGGETLITGTLTGGFIPLANDESTLTDSIISQTGGAVEVDGDFSVTGTVTDGTWNGVTIGVPYGGTGLASGTSGGVPYFSASTTIASSAALGATQVVLGGGAGAAPNASASLTFDGNVFTVTGIADVQSAAPNYALTETDASADNKGWWMYANGGVLNFATVTDALSTTSWLTVTRSSGTPTALGFTATASTFNGTLTSTGNLESSGGVIKARGLTLTHASSGAVLLDSLDQTGIASGAVPQYDGANVTWALVGTGSLDTTGAVEGDVLYFDGANVAWGVITGFSGDDGSAANPTYGFVNEASPTGLGMYRSAADTLGFATNGVERVTISDSVFTVAGIVHVQSAAPNYALTETDASADNKGWWMYANSEVLNFACVTDALASTNWLTVTRSGGTPVLATFPYAVTITGNLNAGTIASGTWSGTAIGVTKGGTGLTGITADRIPYASASNTIGTSANLTYDGSAFSTPTAVLSTGLRLGNATALTFTASGSSNTTYLFQNTDTSGQRGAIFALHTTGTGGPTLGLMKGRGTLASPTVVSSGDVLGNFVVYGYDGTDYEQSGRILFYVDGTPGSNDMPTGMRVDLCADGSSTLTTQFTIASTGYITQRADVDMTNIFGRVRIDSRTTDTANFSHYDMSSTTQMAIQQTASGATTINAASGQGIAFAIAGSATGACASTGDWAFGAASTNTVTMTGRLLVRSVTDAGPMTATAGTQREIVYNTSNSKFYGCTVTGSPATWAALN